MLKIKSILQKPLVWISLFLLLLTYIIHFRNEVKLQNFIFSDGEGYYAYLPALFLNNDASFTKSMQAKQTFYKEKLVFYYKVKTKNGGEVNKYFPGLALLQTPSFLATTGVLKLLDKETNGYSNGYIISFLLSAFLFLLFGIYYFRKSLDILTAENGSDVKYAWIAFCSIFFGTNIFFLCLAYPSFSHLYSFFLFALLLFQFQKYIQFKESKRLYYLGLIVGFIFLVRPINIVFVIFLLFFFDSWKTVMAFLKELIDVKSGRFLKLFFPFALIIAYWLFINKWQTGSFLSWSYQGEGVNFTHPKLLETWFSYRIGIFVHHPILLIALVALFFVFKENKFKFCVWLLYFVLISYLISSWWCWDYESTFGNRGFTEHLVIFMFPLLTLLQQTKKRKIYYGFILLALIYTGMRFYQRVMLIFPREKFTEETFWSSMIDLDDSQSDKYLNHSRCEPYGKIKKTNLILQRKDEFTFDEKIEFGLDATYRFPQTRLNNKFFIEVEFEKKMQGGNWIGVNLVADAESKEDSSRFYFPQGVYEDYQEATNGKWLKTRCYEEIPVSYAAKDKVVIYFWNQAKKKFSIRNLTVKVKEYESK